SVASITLSSAGAAATATVAVSPYTITPSAAVGTGLKQYNVCDTSARLTLTPVILRTKANDVVSKPYGTTYPFDTATPSSDFTVRSEERRVGEACSTLTSAGASATKTVAGSPYTITPSAAGGTGLSNYNISYSTGGLQV